ncbi:hypothetical protein H072_3903 [Dactylellina haptotyla CBS 200.50]|uniref:FAD-binding domain-containing protein n=1 Tax=Dactylellina haptotyla (strain CBS 200.50) TaxID=1284197 RepID=S8C392_DACHA|nr:hypothetical protein H072_3903 [Dactylellina haptotyla CBS 200.50]
MASSPTILVIGGGLSGLSLSLFLTRFLPQATIKIYEARPASQPSTSGTINMTPNALRVLDHIGIYQSLIPDGYNFDTISMMNHRFDTLATIPMAGAADFGYQALRIERSFIHLALLAKVKEQSQIEVIYGSKCSSVSESDSGVTVTFENGTTSTGDLLIACDGIHSTVRKSFMANPEDHDPKYMQQVSIGGFISTSEIEKYNTKNATYPMMMFGPESETGANFMIWPYTRAGDEVTFFTTISKPDEEEDWKSYAGDGLKLKELLTSVFGGDDSPWNEMVRKTVELSDPERYRFWAFYLHNLPDKFYSEKARIIIIGDAAHAMPPSGGQGGAMAFEDAESLAYALSYAYGTSKLEKLDKPQGLEIVQKWSEHRIARIKTIQELNKRMSDMRKGNSGSTSGMMFTFKVWVIWILGLLGVLGRTRRVINDYNAKQEMINLFGEDVAKLE